MSNNIESSGRLSMSELEKRIQMKANQGMARPLPPRSMSTRSINEVNFNNASTRNLMSNTQTTASRPGMVYDNASTRSIMSNSNITPQSSSTPTPGEQRPGMIYSNTSTRSIMSNTDMNYQATPSPLPNPFGQRAGMAYNNTSTRSMMGYDSNENKSQNTTVSSLTPVSAPVTAPATAPAPNTFFDKRPGMVACQDVDQRIMAKSRTNLLANSYNQSARSMMSSISTSEPGVVALTEIDQRTVSKSRLYNGGAMKSSRSLMSAQSSSEDSRKPAALLPDPDSDSDIDEEESMDIITSTPHTSSQRHILTKSTELEMTTVSFSINDDSNENNNSVPNQHSTVEKQPLNSQIQPDSLSPLFSHEGQNVEKNGVYHPVASSNLSTPPAPQTETRFLGRVQRMFSIRSSSAFGNDASNANPNNSERDGVLRADSTDLNAKKATSFRIKHKFRNLHSTKSGKTHKLNDIIIPAECHVVEDKSKQSNLDRVKRGTFGEEISDMSIPDSYPADAYHGNYLTLCFRFLSGTGCVGILIMGVLIFAIVVPLSRKNSGDDGYTSARGKTTPPTLSPTHEEHVAVVGKIKSTFHYINNELDMNSDSETLRPQARALDWILNYDDLRLSSTDGGLIQRYALAVLFFATSDSSGWYSREEWLTGKDVCEWEHVTCLDRSKDRSDAAEKDLINHNNGSKASSTRFRKHQSIGTSDFDAIIGLNLRKNGLKFSLPSEIGKLDKLDSLEISENEMTGKIPKELYYLKILTNLNMAKNKFQGHIADEIENLENLQMLSLYSNEFSGSVSESFGRLKHLSELYLHSNRFEGFLPARLTKLDNLAVLDVANNVFSGTLPRDIINLNKLHYIELSYNRFVGTIPTEFGSIKSLYKLRMNYNRLTGTLPSQLGHLAALMYLEIENNNEIKGTIPSEIGNLKNLVSLKLGFCGLTGTLPAQLGYLENLAHLNVHNNHISGTIPTEFGLLTNLTEGRFQYTDLKGKVPDEICSLRSEKLSMLEADCEDEIVCMCCSRCSH